VVYTVKEDEEKRFFFLLMKLSNYSQSLNTASSCFISLYRQYIDEEKNEQTTRPGNGGLVLRQSAVIDEEKGEIYNHTQHEERE
jgi:hypothetical protein